MEEILQISLSNIRSTFPVEIDGHEYTARKLGAGEELDQSAQTRRLLALIDELDALAKNKLLNKDVAKVPKADQAKHAKLTKRVASITDEVDAIQRSQFETSLRMLDDGVGGSKTRELLGSLTLQERHLMFTQIFASAGLSAKKKAEEEAEKVKAELEEKG